MRLPRDVSGRQLVKCLGQLGYVVTRQKGSHLRLTTILHGEHHITIPEHDSLRVGTLRSILGSVAAHCGMTVEELAGELLLGESLDCRESSGATTHPPTVEGLC